MWIVGDRNQTHEDEWRQVCATAASLDEAFAVFRSNPTMQLICENNGVFRAEQQLQMAREIWPNVVPHAAVLSKGDRFGGPAPKGYVQFGLHQLGVTSCRYVKILADCVARFGSLNNKSVLEIGGGYGGLCRMICDMFPAVQYSLLDLPEALALQRRFVNARESGDRAASRDLRLFDCQVSFDSVPAVDLVISSYAFSEINADSRDRFIPMFGRARCGYIAWNNIGQPGDCLTFTEAERWFRANLPSKSITCRPEYACEEDPNGLAATCLIEW